jgi:RimJ/RimL family protein N-acetyltransferase
MVILETPRLLFRDHDINDLEPFCAMEAEPEVRRFVGGPRSRAGAERKFKSVYLPPVPDRLGLWATVFKPTGQYVGYCGVYPRFGPHSVIPGEGTLAFYLARAYWGQGLASEAGAAFVSFAFKELGLSRLVATVQVGNVSSVRVVEKLGFTLRRLESGESRSYNHYELAPAQGPKRA